MHSLETNLVGDILEKNMLPKKEKLKEMTRNLISFLALIAWIIGFGLGTVLYESKEFIGKHLLYKQHKRKGWTMHKPSARN